MKKWFSLVFLALPILLVGLTFTAAEKTDKPAKEKDAAAAVKASKKPDKPVDINNASEKELMMLPGVGATTAKAIIAGRPFQSVDDLAKVKGIGDKTLAKLKPHAVCNPTKK